MLENIKFLLNLTDDKHDKLINLYLTKMTNIVLAYCSISELNPTLESFIEDKVLSIIEPKINGGGNENTGEVKSISRGDTKIEYNVGEAITQTSIKGAILTEADKKFLNSFKPTSWRLL